MGDEHARSLQLGCELINVVRARENEIAALKDELARHKSQTDDLLHKLQQARAAEQTATVINLSLESENRQLKDTVREQQLEVDTHTQRRRAVTLTPPSQETPRNDHGSDYSSTAALRAELATLRHEKQRLEDLVEELTGSMGSPRITNEIALHSRQSRNGAVTHTPRDAIDAPPQEYALYDMNRTVPPLALSVTNARNSLPIVSPRTALEDEMYDLIRSARAKGIVTLTVPTGSEEYYKTKSEEGDNQTTPPLSGRAAIELLRSIAIQTEAVTTTPRQSNATPPEPSVAYIFPFCMCRV